MAKKLRQRYVKQTGDTLRYQRAIPTKLRHISPTQLFTRPLGLSSKATDAEIAVAWAEAEEAFKLHLKTIENSSPSAYTETEIERLAEDYLRRRNLQRGQFADVVDPDIRKVEDELQENLQPDAEDYADHVIPQADEIRQEIFKDANRQPSIQEAAILRAHQAVQTRRAITPKTLGMFWDSYLRHRDVDVRTKDGVRIQGLTGINRQLFLTTD